MQQSIIGKRLQGVIDTMKTDLERLLKDTVITQESYEWLKPLYEQEIADLEEINQAALERKNNPFYQNNCDSDSDSDDGLLTTSITTLEGIEGIKNSVRFVADSNSSGHGNKVWHASIATCRYLKDYFVRPLRNNKSISGELEIFRCLELGAGTAVPSFFLAKILLPDGNLQEKREEQRLPKKSILRITDARYYRNIMQILRSTELAIEEPQSHTSTSASTESVGNLSLKIEVHPHNWGEPIGFGNQNVDGDKGTIDSSPHDLVIVSDCIYNPEYHDDLLASLSRALALPISKEEPIGGGVAVVSFSLHGNVQDAAIWEFLESKLPSKKREEDGVVWGLEARCVSCEQNPEAVQDKRIVREGWNMETTMNQLGMVTEGIKRERWIAYVYEITWAPME